MRFTKKIALGCLSALACLSLVGCESRQDRETDRANEQSNNVSAYVEHHFNHGAIHGYTRSAVYDKISDTVVFYANNYTSSQLKAKSNNPTKTHVQKIVKKDMTGLAKSTGDRNVKVNIEPAKMDKTLTNKK